MRRRVELAGFLIGCGSLVAAFGVVWVNWGRLSDRATAAQVLMAATLAVAVFLAVIGGTSRGRDRWRAILLGGFLILGLCIVLFDVGILFLPLVLVLLILPIFKLSRKPA
jgi:nitrate/nitrite transporter NarK